MFLLYQDKRDVRNQQTKKAPQLRGFLKILGFTQQ
jgi:hypothetical protein